MTGRAHHSAPAPAVRLMALAILVSGIIFAATVAWQPASAHAGDQGVVAGAGLQLVMIEDPGCPYCARWDREVGEAYAASAEGRFAPLVRRHRGHPDVAGFVNVVYSPTFLVVRDGVEIGRIVGYPGPDFFWGLLGKILERAGFVPSTGDRDETQRGQG